MQLTEIENLSAAELKAKRDELAAAIAGSPPEDLAARYVQARYDAKARDEKLAEQGQTIVALQQGNQALTDNGLKAAQALKEQSDRIEQLQLELSGAAVRATAAQDRSDEALAAAIAQRDAQAQRADRLQQAATRHHSAVASAAKTLNEALSAQAIDSASQPIG